MKPEPSPLENYNGWINDGSRMYQLFVERGVFDEVDRLYDEDAAGIEREVMDGDEFLRLMDETIASFAAHLPNAGEDSLYMSSVDPKTADRLRAMFLRSAARKLARSIPEGDD